MQDTPKREDFNIHKYLSCLESLKLWDKAAKLPSDYPQGNLQALRSGLGLNDESVHPYRLHSTLDQYAAALFFALNQVVSHHDLDSDAKDELVGARQINLLGKVVAEAVTIGLTPHLPTDIVLPMELSTPPPPTSQIKLTADERLTKLRFAVEMLEPVLSKKTIAGQPRLESALIQYMFCCFYLVRPNKADADKEKALRCRQLVSREQYFRYLMLLKGLRGLTSDVAMLLHRQLLSELKLSGGFELLCRLLLKSSSDVTSAEWPTYEVIARIVGAKGHSGEFYAAVVRDIFLFLRACLLVKEHEMFIPACVTALKQLHGVVSEELRALIEERLTSWLEKVKQPPEVVAGVEVFSNTEFHEHLQTSFCCFGGLPMVKLPSKILVPHSTALFRVYCLAEVVNHEPTKNAIATVLNYILNNRSSDELKSFIEDAINLGRSGGDFSRLVLKPSAQMPAPSMVVCAEAEAPSIEGSRHLVSLVKDSANTMLMYNVFVTLLEMLQLDESTPTSGDLLFPGDTEQLGELLSTKFFQRYTIVEMLQELIAFKPLHQQFIENPAKIIEFIENLLQKQIELFKAGKIEQTDAHLTILLLTVFNELIDGLKNLELQTDLRRKIQQFKDANPDPETREQLELLLGDVGDKTRPSRVESDFKEALRLASRAEPHIKVNGSMQLIKLINQKDPEAVANRFKILAVAMTNLKDVESYAYLNTVRLLVALTNLIEAEVVDTLLSEFKNENLDVDHRLKLGEVIVKVTEALGPMAYKYKTELVDCFLRGCLAPTDEIRASSFSKLGTICRILTYQIHSFFQEALTIIQQTLLSDQYVPARRAAVMVLSQLLQGMDNLLDYQEYLLAVYRCLKGVIQTETDDVTRIHAALSLETLNKLVKEFLNPEQIVQREIRVLGIAEEAEIKDIKYK